MQLKESFSINDTYQIKNIKRGIHPKYLRSVNALTVLASVKTPTTVYISNQILAFFEKYVMDGIHDDMKSLQGKNKNRV